MVAHAASAQLRALVESTQDLIWAVDCDFRLIWCNQALAAHFKREFGEDVPLLGAGATAPSAERTKIWLQLYARALVEGPFRIEQQLTDARWIELSLNPIVEGGKSTGVSIFGKDITARKNLEKELRETAERYRKIMQMSAQSFAILRLSDRKYVEVNRAFTELTGYAPEEVIGRTPLEIGILANPQDAQAFLDSLKREGIVRNMELMFRKRNGEFLWGLLSGTLLDLDGEPFVFTIALDITDRKQLEQQFQQAQKMEAVGRLAGGVAHDFNNVLSVITGYSELALEDPDLPERSRRRLNEIKNAASRAAGVTRQLLALSRKQVRQAKILSLNTVVRETTEMLVRLVGADIELVMTLDPNLGTVAVDPTDIDQVILNLVVNARDAMPRGGRLTIETANISNDSDLITGRGTLVAGEYVMLAVSDTGIGMDAETQKLIFEPFFTTKAYGQGTGLGLSTVFAIIEQSGGSIWTYSEPGRGTTFKIYLKRTTASCPGVVPQGPDVIRGGGETILLVEDEPGLRIVNAELLRSLGYRVMEAAEGAEALKLIERSTGPLDLLLTDVIMPVMTGPELAEKALLLRPALQVLFVSGYTGSAVGEKIEASGAGFLQKPLSRTVLAARLRELLDSA